MRCLIRLALSLFLAAGLAAGSGCGRNEDKPNPELKVPPIPPGGKGSKAPVTAPPKQ